MDRLPDAERGAEEAPGVAERVAEEVPGVAERGADRPRAAASEARQRWRLVLRREPDAAPLSQRDVTAAFDEALAASGLPLVASGRSRSRVAFGAPLQVGMAAEGELADLLLAERRPVHEVRDRLAAVMPAGYRLVDLHDVWLGEPPLAAQVIAADYRVSLVGLDPPIATDDLERAAAALLAARELPRERPKGGGTVRYDLRPLLVDVSVDRSGGLADAPPNLRIRTRFHAELGTGRPEEVVGALAERVGRPLEAAIVRVRVILAGEA